MSRCEVFKKPNDVYIYICRNQCDEVWSNFVHSYYAYWGICFAVDSWRSGLPCVAAVALPCPLNPSDEPLFYTSTHANCAFIPAPNTVPDTARLEQELREAWISI